MRERIHCRACAAPLAEADAFATPTVVRCPWCDSYFVTPAPDCSLPASEQVSDDRGEITDTPPPAADPPRPPVPTPDRAGGPGRLAGPSVVDLNVCKSVAAEASDGMFLPGVAFTLLTLAAVVPLGVFCESLLPYSGVFVAATAAAPFNAGMVHVCLRHLKLLRIGPADFLHGFRPAQLARVLVAQAFVVFACLVPLLPGLVGLSFAGGPFSGRGLLSLAALACGLPCSAWLYVRLGLFCLHFILDRGCDPVEAIRGTWWVTRGSDRRLLRELVETVPLLALGGLLFGIPLLLTRPYYSVLLATGYLISIGTPPVRPRRSLDLAARETVPSDAVQTSPGAAGDALTARPPSDPPTGSHGVRTGHEPGERDGRPS